MWLSVTFTIAMLLLFIVLVKKVYNNSSRFSRAHSIIATYIFLVLTAQVLTASYGLAVLTSNAGGLDQMTMHIDCGSSKTCDANLYLGDTNYLQVISAGLLEMANWGLACLFYFTTIVMSMSLQWETIVREALGLLKEQNDSNGSDNSSKLGPWQT